MTKSRWQQNFVTPTKPLTDPNQKEIWQRHLRKQILLWQVVIDGGKFSEGFAAPLKPKPKKNYVEFRVNIKSVWTFLAGCVHNFLSIKIEGEMWGENCNSLLKRKRFVQGGKWKRGGGTCVFETFYRLCACSKSDERIICSTTRKQYQTHTFLYWHICL